MIWCRLENDGKRTICFNCKEEVENAFMIEIKAKFSPIFRGIGNDSSKKLVEEIDTTKYENILCSTCCLCISKMLSDNVRPPDERGKTYDLVVSDKVRTR